MPCIQPTTNRSAASFPDRRGSLFDSAHLLTVDSFPARLGITVLLDLFGKRTFHTPRADHLVVSGNNRRSRSGPEIEAGIRKSLPGIAPQHHVRRPVQQTAETKCSVPDCISSHNSRLPQRRTTHHRLPYHPRLPALSLRSGRACPPNRATVHRASFRAAPQHNPSTM